LLRTDGKPGGRATGSVSSSSLIPAPAFFLTTIAFGYLYVCPAGWISRTPETNKEPLPLVEMHYLITVRALGVSSGVPVGFRYELPSAGDASVALFAVFRVAIFVYPYGKAPGAIQRMFMGIIRRIISHESTSFRAGCYRIEVIETILYWLLAKIY
jgi:hypothetical protein